MNRIGVASVNPLKDSEVYESLCFKISEKRLCKANGYRFEKDRLLCIGAELLLLKMLDAENPLDIQYSEKGKPYLVGSNIHFNWSHSGEYVLCALSDEGEVGCDIEQIGKANLQLAKKFFSDNEYLSIISSLASDEAFYQVWTKKESYLKAKGTGLTDNLKNLDYEPSFNFKKFSIPGYCASLCSVANIENTELEYMHFSKTCFSTAYSNHLVK